MKNPFVKEKVQCILCRHKVQVDYKVCFGLCFRFNLIDFFYQNVRLLSQFVSPFTGKLYDKHITGLCEKQHRAVRLEISRAIRYGLMSPYYRDLKFQNDPKLFDPTRPIRPNPY